MYRRLGETVSRFPLPTMGAWIVIALVVILAAPSFIDVWQDGEFAFLPENSPSRQAEELFRNAFPQAKQDGTLESAEETTSVQQNPLGSSIVIVLVRDERSGLRPGDEEFIQETLLPGLEHIQKTSTRGRDPVPLAEAVTVPSRDRVVRGIVTMHDRRVGSLLTSEDRRATLVVVELATEFLDRNNYLVLSRVEEFLANPDLQRKKPIGLALALSGSSTVGRDMLRAEIESAKNTEALTKILVVVLLLLIYRSPLLALVPLVTVGVAVEMTLALLRHLAGWGFIGLFTGIEVYVTVVVYGAGVDYCLFLIARYKEELDAGASFRDSIRCSIQRVGAALATSAGTSICGIGMMGFAEFGKFRQAGFAISFGLFVVLCFALTFTPAFLLVLHKWAFWPDVRKENLSTSAGWLPARSLWKRLNNQRWIDGIWTRIANQLRARPGTIFILTVVTMLPLAYIGVVSQDQLSYGLLTDLSPSEPSVYGAEVVQEHFPGGISGPTSVMIKFDKAELRKRFEGDDLSHLRTAEKLSEKITNALETTIEEFRDSPTPLDIVDIRNQTNPLGTSDGALEYIKTLRARIRTRNPSRNLAHKTYVSLKGPHAGTVMRIDLVSADDPFSRQAISRLSNLEYHVQNAVTQAWNAVPEGEESQAENTIDAAESLPFQLYSLGPTPGIRDLKHSTDRDRIKIDILVVCSVYVVLVFLLRQPAICGYLMVSVIFSYLVTLGVTFLVFRDPVAGFQLDWKVPIYLFTILIAMGEDYNILLMARVKEEQQHDGPVEGVLSALTKTGSIISSCGIIMAGTFFSLMSGTLLGMVQLGFALGFGVLLDTFVVRPILVPAYLIMLYNGQFGWLGPFLGAHSVLKEGDTDSTTTEEDSGAVSTKEATTEQASTGGEDSSDPDDNNLSNGT